MDKPNIFKSSSFHMDLGDVCHLLIKDFTGSGISIGLNNADSDYVEDENDVEPPTPPIDLIDKDGNVYTTVTIGTQEWTIENFRSTTYADDTAIPNIIADIGWDADITGAYCWYNNDIANKTDYGALYNWYAVNSVHGLVYLSKGGVQQTGWRIPTLNDFTTLINYVGGVTVAGGMLKETGLAHWFTPNTGATDTYGYKGMPCGIRISGFSGLTTSGFSWASTANNGSGDVMALIYNSAANYTNVLLKRTGTSVRCVRDVTSTLRDYDGNVYTIITIGTQQWIVENLKVTHYADGFMISNLTANGDWTADTTGAYCWYDNDIANKTVYGALYNWYAVTNAHILPYLLRDGVQETGWRVATETDYTTLSTYLGGASVAGGKLKETGTTHWTTPNSGADNSTGFTAVGAGLREPGGFADTLNNNYLYTSVEHDADYAVYSRLDYDSAILTNSAIVLKNYGLTIRLVRDI